MLIHIGGSLANASRIIIVGTILIVLGFVIKSLYFSNSPEDMGFESILASKEVDTDVVSSSWTDSAVAITDTSPNIQIPSMDDTSTINNDTVQQEFVDSELFIENNILVRLLGTRLPTKFVEELALIEVDGELYEMQTNDILSQYQLRVDVIANVFVVLSVEDKKHTVTLSDVNLLLPPSSKSYDDYMAMTAQEIASRPRILEHIVGMKGRDVLARGVIVSPGMNPDLFAQAGFKVDDVLLKVNGIELSSDISLEEVQAEIKRSASLEFDVLRRGKMVTVFLDIADESLNLTP